MSLNQLKSGRAFVCLVPQAAGKGLYSQLCSWGSAAGGGRAGASLGTISPSGLATVLWQDGIPIAGCAVTMGRSLSPGPTFVGEISHQHCRGVLCSGSCAPVPGENWDSCTSGCCLSALVWSWHACQLEKLDNCSWCPLEMGKGSPAWVLSCLPSAGLIYCGVWLLTAQVIQQSAPGGNAEEIRVYCQQIPMLGSCRESRAFLPYICVVPGLR